MDKLETIAVIEDPFVSKFVRDLLARRGYRILESTAVRIIELLKEDASEVGLVITNRPGDFLEFAPELRVLYLAAAPDPALAAQFPRGLCLKKPFQTNQLLSAVKELTSAA